MNQGQKNTVAPQTPIRSGEDFQQLHQDLNERDLQLEHHMQLQRELQAGSCTELGRERSPSTVPMLVESAGHLLRLERAGRRKQQLSTSCIFHLMVPQWEGHT